MRGRESVRGSEGVRGSEDVRMGSISEGRQGASLEGTEVLRFGKVSTWKVTES